MSYFSSINSIYGIPAPEKASSLDRCHQLLQENETVRINVTEEFHIARARRTCAAMTKDIGFSLIDSRCVEISTSELASNLYFHTSNGGILLFSTVTREGRSGIQIVSIDYGPGIPDIDQAMRDGYSTNGGLGGGLPGIQRLMDEFEITSEPGSGTCIVARKMKRCR